MRPGLLPASRPTPCSVPSVEVVPFVVELFAQDAVHSTDFGLGIAIDALRSLGALHSIFKLPLSASDRLRAITLGMQANRS